MVGTLSTNLLGLPLSMKAKPDVERRVSLLLAQSESENPFYFKASTSISDAGFSSGLSGSAELFSQPRCADELGFGFLGH